MTIAQETKVQSNRDMLVLDGNKGSDSHEIWNQASGIGPAIVPERLKLVGRPRPAGSDCGCTGGACRQRSTLLCGGPDDPGTHPDGDAGFHRRVRSAPGEQSGAGSFDVSADQFTLSLLGPAGISFTDVSIATTDAPYLFVTSGTSFGTPFSVDSFPNTGFTALDAEFAGSGYRTVNEGDTFGLAHVSYSVSASASAGTYTIAPSPDSLFYDVSGMPFSPPDITNGSIRIASAIPEPWALTQAATAAFIGLGLVWRHSRGRRQT